jgi:hypothetical protein
MTVTIRELCCCGDTCTVCLAWSGLRYRSSEAESNKKRNGIKLHRKCLLLLSAIRGNAGKKCTED